MKRNIAILTEWDGTAYGGWQIQANAPTIQENLQKALEKLCHKSVLVNGCSRTDAGVHARGHVSNFHFDSSIPVANIPLALNAMLPGDIAVQAATEMPLDFNARFDACGKQYSYYICNTKLRHALYSRYSCCEARPLSAAAMREAAGYIEGTHDFACFMASGGQVKTTVRTVYSVDLVSYPICGGAIWRIIVRGNGFLYNMVRIIAGTLLYVGLNKLTPQDVREVLRSGHRSEAGKTLPACGLFLDRVFYEPQIFDQVSQGGNGECNLIGMNRII